jgi:hypothetical protein
LGRGSVARLGRGGRWNGGSRERAQRSTARTAAGSRVSVSGNVQIRSCRVLGCRELDSGRKPVGGVRGGRPQTSRRAAQVARRLFPSWARSEPQAASRAQAARLGE